MIKKLLLIFLTIVFLKSFGGSYSPYLPKGTLIKVVPQVTLSTEQLEENSVVYFIAPSDVWVQEEKAVEKGDIFKGYVSMLKMPVLGVNAAMKIKTTDIIKQDGSMYEFNGRIMYKNSDMIGGNLTNPASYNRTVHPRRVYGNPWGGTMQFVPSGEYEEGQHVKINMRDSMFIELDEDYYI